MKSQAWLNIIDIYIYIIRSFIIRYTCKLRCTCKYCYYERFYEAIVLPECTTFYKTPSKKNRVTWRLPHSSKKENYKTND